MSLQINMETIGAVCVGGQWYEITEGTFSIDSYEFGTYLPDEHYRSGTRFALVHGGGEYGICAVGFRFRLRHVDEWMWGPLTSIQAVRGARREW